MFEKVLVAFDGSVYSRRALEFGCKLASLFNAGVRVVSVIDTRRVRLIVYDVLISREEEVRENVEKMLRKTIDEFREKYPSLRIEYVVRAGHPVEEILSEAREWSADLLIIGAKGTSDLKEVSIGGVAEALIENSTIPVLIVK